MAQNGCARVPIINQCVEKSYSRLFAVSECLVYKTNKLAILLRLPFAKWSDFLCTTWFLYDSQQNTNADQHKLIDGVVSSHTLHESCAKCSKHHVCEMPGQPATAGVFHPSHSKERLENASCLSINRSSGQWRNGSFYLKSLAKPFSVASLVAHAQCPSSFHPMHVTQLSWHKEQNAIYKIIYWFDLRALPRHSLGLIQDSFSYGRSSVLFYRGETASFPLNLAYGDRFLCIQFVSCIY